MTDIVERLREHAATSSYLAECRPRGMICEAADEIERMRAALQSIVQGWDWWRDDPHNRCQSVPGDAIEEARALLEEDRHD